ncbi:unnamed protein product, partial [Ilex paraguariensis]
PAYSHTHTPRKMKDNVNGGTKLILLHPFIQKQGSSNNLWLLAFISFFTLAFLLTLIYTRESITTTTHAAASAAMASGNPPISKTIVKALVHYASNSNDTNHMSQTKIKQISEVLRQCLSSSNFLVFSLTPETLLWKALNDNSRTVFIDENWYYAAYVEEKYPKIEAYDVQYTNKMSEMREVIAIVREQVRNECKPVQNLLFSEYKLGLNDLPTNSMMWIGILYWWMGQEGTGLMRLPDVGDFHRRRAGEEQEGW